MVKSAVVMGGGLAGMAAGVRLAQRGVRVTLIETSRRLGGRASSHEDPASGQMIDNCQHVLLGCCTNLIDLYHRLGVADRIAWTGDLHFYDKQGHHDVLAAGDLPAPLHLSLAMLKFRTLNLRQKIEVSRAMLVIMRLGEAGRERIAHLTFTQWLIRHGQSPGTIERYWAVIVVSALNQHPDHAAASVAAQVFQEGFLAHRDAYRMGVSTVPLRQLYDPATAILESVGGSVRFGESVKSITHEGGRITGVVTDEDHTHVAEIYVSALPWDRLDKVIDAELRGADPRLSKLGELRHSPIVGVHLWFDRPVFRGQHMIFVDSPLQWAFNKSGDEPGAAGHHVHCVVSGADALVDEPGEKIVAMAMRELGEYLPMVRSGEAKLLRGKAVKEKRATFRVDPGVEKIRPATTGAVANLLLAGDWTDTGWPATMEGAVRSGYAAAGAAMGQGLVTEDLPKAELYRWIAGRAG